MKYSLRTKMNILKSAETPLYMVVSVDFSSVEAIAHTHLPQNRAVFECFSYCEVEIYALSKKIPLFPLLNVIAY